MSRNYFLTLCEEDAQIVQKITSLSKVEKEIKSLKSQLKEYMEATEKTKAKANNNIVSIVSVKGKKTIDAKALKEDMPEIYSQYETVGKGYSFVKVA